MWAPHSNWVVAAVLLAAALGVLAPPTARADPTILVSVDSVSVLEGSAGAGTATFTVRLSSLPNLSGGTIEYATEDSSALAGFDYVATTGTLEFTSETLEYQVVVPIFGDLRHEPDEAFRLRLSNPSPDFALADSVGLGTLLDDDLPISVRVDSVSVVEGHADSVFANFTVRLSAIPFPGDSLHFATEDLDATAGLDYGARAGTLALVATDTLYTIEVPVYGDLRVEGVERFRLRLSDPSFGLALADTVALGTIVDDDPPILVTVDSVSVVEGHADSVFANFTVRLSGLPQAGDTLVFATEDLDATAGLDYGARAGTLAFTATDTLYTLSVPVYGDTTLEVDERFRLRLSAPSAGFLLADSIGLGTILDDDPPILVTIDSVSVVEGDADSTWAVFSVRLSGLAAAGDTIVFATENLDATPGADYAATAGTLTLTATDTVYTLPVAVYGDTLDEGDEHFRLRLSAPSGRLLLADTLGMATIVDDDFPILVTIDDVRVLEGHSGTTEATFTLRLSAPPPAGDTLDFATVALEATAGVDYADTSGTFVFITPDTVFTLTVPVFGDTVVEGNERFGLRLSNPGRRLSLADTLGLATLVNDERTRFERSFAGLMQYHIGTLAPAFGHANEDGFPDLPLNQNAQDGTFTPLLGMVEAISWSNHHGSAWCDYDRDGLDDLVVTPYAFPDSTESIQLLHNLGGGAYEDVAPLLGLDIAGFAETPVWGDFDGDSLPDLFVPFYSHIPPGRSFLWKNNGDGTFTDVTDSAGVALANVPPEWRPEGADAADWDGDGDLDLYCAQRLFLNDGDGRFTDARVSTGLPPWFDEGSKFVDYDGDGDLDLYLRTTLGPTLFRNDAGTFVDATAAANLPGRPMFWGDSWADADNDGDLDLFFANGATPAELFLNQGDGTFMADSVFDALAVDNSLSAWGDVDLDGDLDVAIGGSDREILLNRLDEKPGADSTSLRVWVLTPDSLRTCFGAILRLTNLAGGPHAVQTRVVDGGSGYLAQGEYAAHFGGLGRGRYSLEVRYPGSPATATVVDGADDARLSSFEPSKLGAREVFVFRDGRVNMDHPLPPENVSVSFRVPSAAPAGLGAPWPAPARTRAAFVVRVESGEGEITVHDVAGRRVRTLVRGRFAASAQPVEWDLRDEGGQRVPAGVYFVRLVSEGRLTGVRRLVVLR